MKKTQIAEAIERVTKLKNEASQMSEKCAPEDKDYHLGKFVAYDTTLILLNMLLPAEREDIEQAYLDGYNDAKGNRFTLTYEYFDKTFKQ